MDKVWITAKLTEMGYKAVLENGVIMCMISNQKAAREVKNILKDLLYYGSWGYRIKKIENATESGLLNHELAEQSDGQMSIMDLLG